jgi:hypothetical protein
MRETATRSPAAWYAEHPVNDAVLYDITTQTATSLAAILVLHVCLQTQNLTASTFDQQRTTRQTPNRTHSSSRRERGRSCCPGGNG